MPRVDALEPRYVEYMPEQLEEGFLYISKAFEVAIHLCCCGCQEKIVTPFDSLGWKLIEHGDKVSLTPSIGNYQISCRTHYFITDNKVRWM